MPGAVGQSSTCKIFFLFMTGQDSVYEWEVPLAPSDVDAFVLVQKKGGLIVCEPETANPKNVGLILARIRSCHRLHMSR
jgi:hypothetical protein